MKLRTKIFLLVGGLFVASFVVSQIIQEFITHSIVNKSEVLFDKKVGQFNEDRQKAFETYLQGEFEVSQDGIEALLNQIQKVRYWTESFSPGQANIETNTWLTAATLLVRDKAIDLIQNVINGKIASMIIIDEPPPYQVLVLPLSQRAKVCVVDSLDPGIPLQGPFIGIPYNFSETIYNENNSIAKESFLVIPNLGFFLLFDVNYVLGFDPQSMKQKIDLFLQNEAYFKQLQFVLKDPEIEAIRSSLSLFYDVMVEAQDFLKMHPELVTQYTTHKKDWFLKQFNSEYDVTKETKAKFTIENEIEIRYEAILKIWQLLCFNATGLYGYDPISFGAPLGLCHIEEGQNIGGGVMTSSLFHNERIGQLSSDIYSSNNSRIFLGKTRNITPSNYQNISDSSLTLAIDIRNILTRLTTASQEKALFIVGDKVIRAYEANGDVYEYKEGSFPIAEILSQNTGSFVDALGVRHYFVNIKPIADDDHVRVILHNTMSREFGMISVARGAAQEMSRNISLQMSLVSLATVILVMILINSLSRKITKPISILSEASRRVGSGNFDEIQLDKNETASEDEIDQLYTAFSEMLEGLKEKERVKGVLNKVVSHQIATKILEGSVELGGEEKVVTVLFADIRHFTELSENIAPTQLIKLLNRYMTIMSKVVDRYDGVIDKYVGDQVMALFGAPLSSVESAHKAVECALEMVSEVKKYNSSHKDKNKIAFDIGIGIHTGIVVAGNMGAENRMNYTVLGSSVNLASRLCAAADAMQILVSKETLNSYHVKENISFEELKPITLKGFSNAVSVFAIHPRARDS
jgi:class 3 adenylate cyclase